jgi:hypothetical protein
MPTFGTILCRILVKRSSPREWPFDYWQSQTPPQLKISYLR